MNYWCESCARKNLCYVVDDRPKCFVPITSNDRTADRKTEPQTCETCKWGEWYRKGYDITMMSDECGGCCSWNSKWKPKNEPQTDCRRCKHYATGKCKECFGHELFTDSGYATDCSWQKGE